MKPLHYLTLAALFVAAASGAVAGDEPLATQAPNIHFTLTMLDSNPGGPTTERTLEALAVDDRGVRTRVGWRVPFAATRQQAEAGDSRTVAYQYQDLGMSVSLQGRSVGGDRIRVTGRVEISGLDPSPATGVAASRAPQIGTFSHDFEATLLDRSATSIVAVPKPDGGFVRLTLTASIEG